MKTTQHHRRWVALSAHTTFHKRLLTKRTKRMTSVLDEIATERGPEIDPFLISAALKDESDPPIVMGLDIGTSGVRAMLFDGRAEEIDSVIVHLAGDLYKPLSSGSDANADALVSYVTEAIDGLLARVAEKISRINLVAVSCFWHSLVGANEAGLAITPVLSWADRRASAEAEQLRQLFDEREFHQRTGCRFHSSYWPAKLLWLRAQHSSLYQEVARWMSFGEYLQLRFFAETEASVSMASGTGLMNQRSCEWDQDLLQKLEISADTLPIIAQPGKTLATLTEPYATRWPALSAAQWFPAVGDGAASNIGAGCTTADSALLMIGTSGAMRVVYEGDPPAVLPSELWSYRVDRRRVVVGGALSDGGGLYRWLRDTLALEQDDAEIERALAAMEPTTHGLTILPFWAGERSTGWSANTQGAILGLTSTTRPLDILRAAMESVAYRFALVSEALDSLAPQASVLAAGNALLASPCWTQIIADVLGRPIKLSTAREASCRGAGLLALEASGKIENLARLSASFDRVFVPDMRRHEQYRLALAMQQATYDRLFT
ncbi:MAG: gluconokinase [Pyrinomonadaceae bacterium]